MFCSNNAEVESQCVLAEITLNRTENLNQAVLFQVQYFKYFLIFSNGFLVDIKGFLQVDYFLLQNEMREEKICLKNKKSKKLFFFISEHIGVKSSGF